MKLIITIVSFLIVDGVWIYFIANPLYKKNLPASFLAEPVRIIYALAFYLLFSFSLWYLFLNRTTEISKSLLIDVFLFGLTAYATYALTNMAIIADWNWRVTLPDLVWGGILSVIVTVITLAILS